MTAERHHHSLFGPYPAIPREDSDVFSLEGICDQQFVSVESPKSNVIYGCHARFTPRKGLGLFAEEDVPAHETIIVEKPSLVHGPLTEEQDARFWCDPKNISRQFANTDLVRNFMNLSQEDQSDIMSLYNGREKQFPSRNWCPGERPNGSTLAGKFLTNRFKISSRLTGIYFRCAMINHSCNPNCTFHIVETKGSTDAGNQWLVIEASRDIKAGDELTISYIPCGDSFEERQALLSFCYGFKCVCFRCTEEKARLYPDGYYGQLFNSQRVALQRTKLANRLGRIQGRNMLTVVKAISGESPSIPKNGILLAETPLMLITKEELKIISKDFGQSRQDYNPMTTRFLQLSTESRREFLNLCDWRRESHMGDTGSAPTNNDMPSPERLLGIWEANRFPLDNGMEGVFPIISNLSHSCSPNCRVSWDQKRKTLNLVAIQPLKVGDQVTICYDHDKVHELLVEKRQQYLRENYGFDCRCLRCIKWVAWEMYTRQNFPLRELGNTRSRPAPTCSYKISESPAAPSGRGPTERRLSQNRRRFGGLEGENRAAMGGVLRKPPTKR